MRTIVNLNKGWQFYKKADLSAVLAGGKGEAVDLPHTWNAVDGQDGGNSPIAAWAFRSMAQMPMCSSSPPGRSRAIIPSPTSVSTMNTFCI